MTALAQGDLDALSDLALPDALPGLDGLPANEQGDGEPDALEESVFVDRPFAPFDPAGDADGRHGPPPRATPRNVTFELVHVDGAPFVASQAGDRTGRQRRTRGGRTPTASVPTPRAGRSARPGSRTTPRSRSWCGPKTPRACGAAPAVSCGRPRTLELDLGAIVMTRASETEAFTGR